MAGIATISTGSMGKTTSKERMYVENADYRASLSNALQKGQSINESRNSSVNVAAKTQPLSNQTGGNIMGFTYE